MTSKYNVIWADVAEKDLIGIIEYISEESPQNALKILKKIRQKAHDLYVLPEKGRVVPELQDQGIVQYRELIITPWRLIYRISGRKIYILSIIDSRRNVEDVLLTRFFNQQ